MNTSQKEWQREFKNIVVSMLKVLDETSQDVHTYGQYVGPFQPPIVEIIHEDKEGTHYIVHRDDYDFSSENEVDFDSLLNVHNAMITTTEYRQFEGIISDYFHDIPQHDYSLDFLKLAIEGNIPRKTLIKRIVDEITSPVRWIFKLFLQGLILNEDSYELNNLKIRKIAPSDFLDNSPWTDKIDSGFVPSHCVIEWQSVGIPKDYKSRPLRIKEITDKLIRIKLTKNGIFKATAWSANASGLLREGIDREVLDSTPLLLGTSPIRRVPEPVRFGIEEKRRYLRFESDVFPLLGTKKNEKVEFALKMLNEAAWKPVDEAILFCVIGLESLFLSQEQELRHKLASRVAILMKYAGKDAESIYDDVWTAYGIRSKFVHGDYRKKLDGIEKESLLYRLTEYLNESAIIWIQIHSTEYKQKEVYDILDRISFSEEKEKRLVSIMKSFST